MFGLSGIFRDTYPDLGVGECVRTPPPLNLDIFTASTEEPMFETWETNTLWL